MYFDQLLLAVHKVHLVYFDQLLGSAHYIHFISNPDNYATFIVHFYYKQLFTLPGVLHSYECATKSLLFWTINTPYFNGIWSTVIESSLLSDQQRSTTKPPRLDQLLSSL